MQAHADSQILEETKILTPVSQFQRAIDPLYSIVSLFIFWVCSLWFVFCLSLSLSLRGLQKEPCSAGKQRCPGCLAEHRQCRRGAVSVCLLGIRLGLGLADGLVDDGVRRGEAEIRRVLAVCGVDLVDARVTGLSEDDIDTLQQPSQLANNHISTDFPPHLSRMRVPVWCENVPNTARHRGQQARRPGSSPDHPP